MNTITFEDKFRVEVNESTERFAKNVKCGAALLFYMEEKLTLGQAAEMAEMTQYEFMKHLGELNVPVISYPADDLKREMNL